MKIKFSEKYNDKSQEVTRVALFKPSHQSSSHNDPDVIINEKCSRLTEYHHKIKSAECKQQHQS